MRAVVPHRLIDRRAQPQVRPEPPVVDDLVEVPLQLDLAGMGAGPVVVLEGIRVEVGLHVDLHARVPVVPPRAANS